MPSRRRNRPKAQAFHRLATSDATPILPERLVADLTAVLPEDAVVVADPGTPCPYLSAFLPVARTGRHFITNRAHGALGYSLSAAVGAHVGRPAAKTVAVMGDGSFGFTIGEMETVARLGLPITFVVVSNGVYGWIKGRPEIRVRPALLLGRLLDHGPRRRCRGLRQSGTWRVTDPAALKAALGAAVDHRGAGAGRRGLPAAANESERAGQRVGRLTRRMAANQGEREGGRLPCD